MLAPLLILLALIPFIIYFARQIKTTTPSLQWPVLAQILKFQYQDKPPRLLGDFEGRHVSAEPHNGGVLVSMQLSRPSRLRVEVGPREDVARRAGMIVPDPVMTGDAAFEARLLARCSDKAAGVSIFDPALRQNILAQPFVDSLGIGDKIQWMLPELKEPETLERVLEVMTAIAAEMERFPANA
jgi:hypothetical protein